jgi:hypothetical protein
MQQLRLIHTPTTRRSHAVPTTCPFTVGQTVRNTRLDRTGRVLEQLHDPLMPGSWWVRVHVDAQPDTRWLASLCEVA